jgi:hypothetical protein
MPINQGQIPLRAMPERAWPTYSLVGSAVAVEVPEEVISPGGGFGGYLQPKNYPIEYIYKSVGIKVGVRTRADTEFIPAATIYSFKADPKVRVAITSEVQIFRYIEGEFKLKIGHQCDAEFKPFDVDKDDEEILMAFMTLIE